MLGTFTWDLSLDNFRLGSFGWDLSLGIFRFGWLVLGNFRLETLAWELLLGNSRLEPVDWDLRLGEPSSSVWGTGWRELGEPGGTGSYCLVFKVLSKSP